MARSSFSIRLHFFCRQGYRPNFSLHRQGRDPLDACLETGSCEAAALLIAHFPGTVYRLVQRCSRLIFEQDSVCRLNRCLFAGFSILEQLEKVLLHICKTNLLQCREILLALAEMTVVAGQQV